MLESHGITLNPCWAEENRCNGTSLGGQDETDAGLVLPGAISARHIEAWSKIGRRDLARVADQEVAASARLPVCGFVCYMSVGLRAI